MAKKLRFGRVVLRFLETPGPHARKHLHSGHAIWSARPSRSPCLPAILYSLATWAVPDLSPDHTPQQLAGLMFDSLHQKLLKLPDSVEVYPAHGAGSLCGRNISQERSSTIGRNARPTTH